MVDRRHIYILPYPTDTEFYTLVKKISSPMEKSSGGDEENFTTPSEENFTENNTLINNTKNNTKNIYSVEQSSTMSELFEKVWKTYPKKTNKKKPKSNS